MKNILLLALLAIVLYCGGIYSQVTTITTSSLTTVTGTSAITTATNTGISSVTTSVTRTVATSTVTTGIQTETDTISVTGTVTTPVSAAYMEKPAWGSATLALLLLALTIFIM